MAFVAYVHHIADRVVDMDDDEQEDIDVWYIEVSTEAPEVWELRTLADQSVLRAIPSRQFYTSSARLTGPEGTSVETLAAGLREHFTEGLPEVNAALGRDFLGRTRN